MSKLNNPFGNNRNAGNYVELNGVRLYYEIYGTGEPIVLIHGNGGNISYLEPQIKHFRRHYKVIVPDCRGRGKSELGTPPLTYTQMTQDIVSLLDYLNVDSANIAGRSDGAIISLLMGIFYPGKVKKIAAFAGNLSPDSSALYPEFVKDIHRARVNAENMIKNGDTTENWTLIKELYELMEFQPQILIDDLRKIECPVLVMSCDRDIIREEHTLLIYQNIRNSNLCIFPGETHWMTTTSPDLFNSTVEKFFSEPFKGEETRR